MKILGIETSCDETAAAVVENGENLLSNVIATSALEHVKYGGVVPEIAARSQLESIIPVIAQALEQAKTNWSEIDALAVSYGPGLSGSLLIGVMTAKTLALNLNKPLYAVNHVQAHVYANFITKSPLKSYSLPSTRPKFPLLAIIVSGGHSQLVLFTDHRHYLLLGQTQDDAVGEAFDKVAKMLGLAYPGGPSIAQAASRGNANAFHFPVANMPGYDFSFSGLKTAVLRQAQAVVGENYTFPSIKLPNRLKKAQIADLAASFQIAAVNAITNKVKKAVSSYKPVSIVLAGGVAANSLLRQQLKQQYSECIYPDIKLCTDNGAMVASLAYFLTANNYASTDPYALVIEPALSM